MKILVKGKVETVSLDRVKPAHLECEPTTGTNIQRTTPNKHRARRLPGSLVGIHRVHLDLVVRTLRRPTGRVLKRKSPERYILWKKMTALLKCDKFIQISFFLVCIEYY